MRTSAMKIIMLENGEVIAVKTKYNVGLFRLLDYPSDYNPDDYVVKATKNIHSLMERSAGHGVYEDTE